MAIKMIARIIAAAATPPNMVYVRRRLDACRVDTP